MAWADQIPDDQAGISDKIAQETGAKAGDTISFTYGSSTYEVQVALVYKAFIFNGVLLHADAPIFASKSAMTFQGCYIDCREIEGKRCCPRAPSCSRSNSKGATPKIATPPTKSMASPI
jgi:hypothetical protein